MATYTPNYNLKKPASSDTVDIADINGNMDIIDGQLADSVVSIENYYALSDSNSIAPEKIFAELPSGYTQVGYLSGSSSGYIITDYNFSTGDSIEFKIYLDSRMTSDNCFLGASGNGTIFLNGLGNQYQIITPQSGSNTYVSGLTKNQDNVYRLDSSTSAYSFKRDGTTIWSKDATTTAQTMSGKTIVMASGNGGYPMYGKVYYMRAYNSSGQLKCDYIPCIRDSDGKVGLYDVVNNVFCVATGTLTAGPIVMAYTDESVAPSSTLPYVWHFTRATLGDGSYEDSEIAVIREYVATAGKTGSYNDLSNKPTIPTVDSALSGTSTNPVQNQVVKGALDDKLDKTTYEWNAELSIATSGKVLVFKGEVYDTNLTIDIASTTHISYSGTLVMAFLSGDIRDYKIFGDVSGALASKLYIVPTAYEGNRILEVYFNADNYSKNLMHIQAIGLRSATNILESVSEIPATATLQPKNVMASKLDVATHEGSPYNYVYGVYQSTQGQFATTESATAGTIPWRGIGGRVKVGTPTGDEDATTKAYVDGRRQVIANTSVSTWASDNTYTDYPYRASIAITGVTANDVAEIVFGATQATSGDYAPVCETYAGGVYIYSAVNTAITIPTIIVFKG